MKAKLQKLIDARKLRARFPYLSFTNPDALLRYANHDFASKDAEERAQMFLGDLSRGGWNRRRTFDYLKSRQNQFRDCLAWLADDAAVKPGNSATDLDKELQEWNEYPALKFLRLHGLVHGGVDLGFRDFENGFYLGLDLVQKKPRDPLDILCWHLLSILMLEGELQLSQCAFDKKFFFASRNKRFCDDDCRAKFHQARKTPAEKAKYMREYRANPKLKGRVR